MKNTCISLFFLLCTLSSFAQRPKWTYQQHRERLFPKTEYLQGFYQVPMANFEQDKLEGLEQLAKTALIEHVRVNVQNVSTLKERSYNDELDTYFQSESKVSSELELSGLIVESFYNKYDKEAYAFAYVKRSDLIDFYTDLLQNNIEKGNKNNHEIKMNLVERKVGTALQWYNENVASYIKIKEYTSVLNGLGIPNKKLPIVSIDQFERELFRLHAFISKRLELKKIAQTSEDVGVRVLYESEPIDGVKIRFDSLENGAKTFKTDLLGIASIPKDELPSQNHFLLKANVDIWTELPQKLLSRYKGQTQSLAFIGVSEKRKIIEAQVFIQVTELSFGKLQSNSLIEGFLKDLLSLRGYVFTGDLEKAQYIIIINAENEKGNTLYGRYTSFADVNVSVKETQSGLELYQNKYVEVRGIGRSYKKAGKLAFENVLPNLEKDILKTIQGE